MGKFDGILICSDVDDTFRCDIETARVNGEAVKYFTENGGKFTFATGRSVPHIKNSELLQYINAPAVNLNGGMVYDYSEDRVIYESRLGFSVGEFIEFFGENLDLDTQIYIFCGCDEDDTIICTKETLTDSIMRIKPIKLYLIASTEKKSDELRKSAEENLFLKECYISKSWLCGVEIDCSDATKGHGMDRIREYIGNIHTTIGIGNYGNDIPLIKHADIGVAVENATDEVKACADLIVKSCKDFSIRNLVEIIEEKVKK